MAIKHWDCSSGSRVSRPDVDAFVSDILKVCRKHRMTLAHEDDHGSFVILGPDYSYARMLLNTAIIGDKV